MKVVKTYVFFSLVATDPKFLDESDKLAPELVTHGRREGEKKQQNEQRGLSGVRFSVA